MTRRPDEAAPGDASPEPRADASRIGMVGISRGGMMTYLASTLAVTLAIAPVTLARRAAPRPGAVDGAQTGPHNRRMQWRAARWVHVAAGVSGLGVFAAAMLALWSIPRTSAEFLYVNSPDFMRLFRPLPFAPMTGFTPEQLSSHVVRGTILLLACILVGIAIAPRLAGVGLPSPGALTLALVGSLLVTVAAGFVIRGVPLQDDEATYVMQTEILAHGHLLDAYVPPEARFDEPYTVFGPRGTTGKYLFGGPLALLPGSLLGAPVLGHILLAGLTLLLLHRSTAAGSGSGLAAVATGLLALSPQFVFTSATVLPQALTLAALATAVWALMRGGFAPAVLAGLAMGWAAAARPQVAVPCGLVLLPFFFRNWRMVAGAALGAAPWLVGILAYDWVVTGDPLRLPWFLYSREVYGFGRAFAAVPFDFTLIGAIEHTLVVLTRLNGWALGWPLSLAGPAAWFLLRCPHREVVAPWAWIAGATFVFQFAYYSPGTSDTGAIYHHAALPFLCLATASALVTLAGTPARGVVLGVALAATLLGTGTFLAEHAWRLRRLTTQIAGPDRDGLPLRAPALLLEETLTAGHPTVGWVFGPPFRPRASSDPVVVYPLGSPALMRWLRGRYPDRSCNYLVYDTVFTKTSTVLPCTDIRTTRERLSSRQARVPQGQLYADPTPPWQAAFRWVPFLSVPDPAAAGPEERR